MGLKWIDIPPVWLAGHLAALWLGRDTGPQVTGRVWDVLGTALIAAGLLLMAGAVAVMVAARTTPIPHQAPAALVTGGPFRVSRNPIYLGDALVLTGAIAWTGAVWGVILVPLFVAIVTRRFIHAEEDRLAAAFGDAFHAWAARTRRWI